MRPTYSVSRDEYTHPGTCPNGGRRYIYAEQNRYTAVMLESNYGSFCRGELRGVRDRHNREIFGIPPEDFARARTHETSAPRGRVGCTCGAPCCGEFGHPKYVE